MGGMQDSMAGLHIPSTFISASPTQVLVPSISTMAWAGRILPQEPFSFLRHSLSASPFLFFPTLAVVTHCRRDCSEREQFQADSRQRLTKWLGCKALHVSLNDLN